MKRLLPILLLLIVSLSASAERVRVRLYSTNDITTLNVSFDLGAYNLYADGDNLLEDLVGEGRSVLVRVEGNKLHVSVNDDDYGSYSTLRLEATDTLHQPARLQTAHL